MPAGRPTDYSEDVAAKICERITDGESLRAICDDDSMPARATVFKWLARHPEFVDQYAIARGEQAETLFDEILDIADDGRNDWMERKDKDGANIGWRENGEALRRSQLRVEARKWMVGKLAPKKYGEKSSVELTGKDGGAIETKDTSDRDLAKAVALLMAKGLNSGSSGPSAD